MITVGKTSISWTGMLGNGELTELSTKGGGEYSIGKWAYLYQNDTKIGFLWTENSSLLICCGSAVADLYRNWKTFFADATIDITDIPDYPYVGEI